MSQDPAAATSPLDRERLRLQQRERELERQDSRLAETLTLEHRLMRRVGWSLVVTVPVCVGLAVGFVALAVLLSNTSTGYAVPLGMAAGIGILAGLFFGVWMAFVLTSRDVEALDHKALQEGATSARRGEHVAA